MDEVAGANFGGPMVMVCSSCVTAFQLMQAEKQSFSARQKGWSQWRSWPKALLYQRLVFTGFEACWEL